eukprot:2015273-Lingulodinium_polyedra.AAC.1
MLSKPKLGPGTRRRLLGNGRRDDTAGVAAVAQLHWAHADVDCVCGRRAQPCVRLSQGGPLSAQ